MTLALAVAPAHSAEPTTTIITTEEVQWSSGPPSLPPGSEIAVLSGDPSKAGPFTFRIRMPANYAIPAHTHPVGVHLTVISGDLHYGLGRRLDRSKGWTLSAGDYFIEPAVMEHYAWTERGSVFQIHGTGPFGITYIDPADDPWQCQPRAAR